jgi:hypothetical protein
MPYRKKSLYFQSLFLIILIRIALWVIPFRVLNKYLSRINLQNHPNNINNWTIVNETVGSVKTCSNYVPYASCLTQALAARTLLRLRGQNPELKIGVNKTNDKLLAHAWLELENRIIIGKVQHQTYVTLNSSSNPII